MKKYIKLIWRTNTLVGLRMRIARIRARLDIFYRMRLMERRIADFESNFYYEVEDEAVWLPKIMGLEETLEYIYKKKCSVCRYGDGEFELIAGRDMSFETANIEMQQRLAGILANPILNCLCCIPNIFGSLARYRSGDIVYWRQAVVWMRPLLKKYLSRAYSARDTSGAILGDPQISRPYLGVSDKSIAPRVFGLWKKLWEGRHLLIVEGRYSRLGIGNDLFDGASSIRRIWCPAINAYAKYDEILSAVKKEAQKGDLILIALGATATILAYDLAKCGYQAIDCGHLDVEYMWMKMGATEKVAIPGRYVNEAANGHEKKIIDGESEQNAVICDLS